MIASGVSQEIPEREAIAVCGDDLALFKGPSTPGGGEIRFTLRICTTPAGNKTTPPPKGREAYFFKII